MTIDFKMNEKKERTAFLFILLAGTGLRLWQIGWGLPEIFEEAFPFHIAAKFWNWNGTGLPYSEWRMVVGQDSHSLGPTSDPKFANPNGYDFSLQSGSPAIDAGVDVGIPFTGSSPDLGVYP